MGVPWSQTSSPGEDPYFTRWPRLPWLGRQVDQGIVAVHLGPVLGLDPSQTRALYAFHEAGHAVAGLVAGYPIRRAQSAIDPADYEGDGSAGHVWLTGPANRDVYDFFVFLMAGLRATDRWLREQGLWTVARGWAAEVLARSDQRVMLHQPTRIPVVFTFGGGQPVCTAEDTTGAQHIEVEDLHDRADRLLGEHWTAVRALAAHLAEHGRADDRQVAELTGLPNSFNPRAGSPEASPS